MNTIATLYQLLNIQQKITNQDLRLLYLKDVWGLPQKPIAECEQISQAAVSYMLREARIKISPKDLTNASAIQFTPDEIVRIQSLPRDVIKDTSLVAFVNNILNLEVLHPFYSAFAKNDQIRIAALSLLGIQNKHLEKVFKKKQSTVSMIIKRFKNKAEAIERSTRYDFSMTIQVMPKHQNRSHNFIIASV